MSFAAPLEGRASLARSYRNLSEREIHAKLDGSLSDAERVTAKAELLRRGASHDGEDTTFVTGFAPTSALDFDAADGADAAAVAAPAPRAARRWWPLVLVLALGSAGALAWAARAGLLHR